MEPSDGDRIQQKNDERMHSLVGSLVEIIPNDVKSGDDDISLSSTSSTRTYVRRGNDESNQKQSDTESSSQSSTRQLRDQMIESLVRFSYHTPIVVLEDLINHQIQTENINANKENKDFYCHKATVEVSGNDSVEESAGLSSSSLGEHDAEKSSPTKMEHFTTSGAHSLPPNRTRESALVFIDISGFTKLSSMLDEETLSRVINSYFEMIISEVKTHGGDVLKFAGDAIFAEWRVPEEADKEYEQGLAGAAYHSCKILKELNSSLASMDCGISKSLGLSIAVLRAARCAVAIVQKYSDHEVAAPHHISDTMGVLNVHCGIGCGVLVGMHASDYKEEDGMCEEDQPVETRREYLFLGSAIDQVSKSANIASNGEVLISSEALQKLSECCDVPVGMMECQQPTCIASRSTSFLDLTQLKGGFSSVCQIFPNNNEFLTDHILRRHCRRMQLRTLSRLHSQAALYVHPVVRGDVWGFAGNAGPAKGTEDIQQRYHTEAELRSVFTMFIKAMVAPELTGDTRIDNSLYSTLRNIMHITSRELDRYSGQLRQFIVDDKGVVVIVVFGLRGSTFSDMVANNALPACFSIQKSMNSSGIDVRIGGTFGKAYCGVVGALRRHEFSVMGAPVNLAARLMDSPMNSGLLVDENVRNQSSGKYAFRSLQPVRAKGYDNPVGILEPVHAMSSRLARKIKMAKFVGRDDERKAFVGFAQSVLDDQLNPHASVVNVVGDSGIGKSALCVSVLNDIKALCSNRKITLIILRSSSTEDQQRIPLCAFRKILLGAIRELCFMDGSLNDPQHEQGFTRMTSETWKDELPPKLSRQSMEGLSSRWRSLGAVEGTFSPVFASSQSFAQHTDSRPGTSTSRVPYLEKLRWACKEAGYDCQYADLIACQFLGLQEASPVTHINGEVPQISDLVECIAQCFIRLVDFAQITVIFIDDFQWVDTFTWRVVRALSQCGKRMLIVRATKSHDKRALRRLSNGMSKGVNASMEITLGPLELDDIKDLISQIFAIPDKKESIDEDVCTYIYQKTGGLPVYVIELLETMKRTNSFVVDSVGKLRLSLRNPHDGEECSALVLSQMLNRFDSLDALVRKILHTCAVLGQSFTLSDVVRVHPDIKMAMIEDSLNVAISEMILVDLGEDEDKSTCSALSNVGSNSNIGTSVGHSRTSSRLDVEGERNFVFSHDMWRKTVLTTLLEARKVKLHRLIAVAMEKELHNDALERSDLSQLLTLFEHWKLSGEFLRAAPLALVVGERLNDWDLLDLSVDICRDALDMSLRSVKRAESRDWGSVVAGDWVKVSSSMAVLNYIIKLHIRIAENFLLLGRVMKCIKSYEDAYTILHSCTIRCCSLRVPVLVGLLSIDCERDKSTELSIPGEESLIEEFLEVAQEEGNPIHLARALSMMSFFHAERGCFETALGVFNSLRKVYNAKVHSPLMSKEYGKDYALDVCSQSTLWFFLAGQEKEAIEQSLFVVKHHLPLQNPLDVNTTMNLLLPCILVLKFVGRGHDAHFIFCRYVVNAHHDTSPYQTYWVEIFNPLIYLLDIVKMEECDVYNFSLLEAIRGWVLNEKNSYYSPDHLRLGHTLMGEICFRLGQLKPVDDPTKGPLLQKARCFLTPIARDVHSEPFLAHSALAFLRAMD